MLNKLAYLLAFLALIQVGKGVGRKCYSCFNDTCHDKHKWVESEACGNSLDQDKAVGVCLSEVYKDKTTHKDVTMKKCVTADKLHGKPFYNCSDTSNEGHKVELCNICYDKDLCNSASAFGFGIILPVTFIVYAICRFV
ncbi:unnamed protein product [Ceutorhynchus assimilis]|uniref:Protein sleepless n=1 Tax=Ceutorhynchus assimilis TaxID=467358 RepID=A0A9N9MM12_9CUCU|nr:unnamed protein product [Ceutorhynchus assimilis]